MKRIRIISFALAAVVLFFLVKQEFQITKSWRAWNLPLSGKVIVLDAGHGGPDGGAVGGKDIIEKDITLEITKKVQDYLQEQGALVILTREGDYDLANKDTKSYSRRKAEDLKKRVEIINKPDVDFFASIHLNALTSSGSKGAQTFYYRSSIENERAAKFIQAELRASLENTNRSAKTISHVYLLKYSKTPGALIEAGFLSNVNERYMLNSEKYQQKVAAAIYRGILRYFTEKGNPPE
ncbi:N-acetylmuramoyl-L-alanine amidase CwlD [Bacillus thuringiensis]|uniref:N-acetylmuramoyl-L-alanine amidase CwlD n=1 Tax=Bacillus thuringiensis TaxID=1428 RepID=UPI000B44B0D0|nr:N-acetylmuramoyl-L-alanine amidase CwlD [Bacillus thuringiensis]MBG9620999.1 N-acetylmuramoyl-L-alanine amidase [Bacillus thuringiensis]MBG9661188.1 N-acetylmuramoyl-L-alanine amidase [Bacillus thuringiensis]MED2641368.1 N-acetylmuramoyl-L-alanine amidase CwlD [Bacillus thuringiensis]OTW42886.1 N-acetylmuramoyl-L-alanine amidase CwlD [Bacillus thuringiensis serovar thuringiensis]HDR8528795.1 N-acetylmuramoyl-L-alanine amidase CwlD [Bacillus thuringiensis]